MVFQRRKRLCGHILSDRRWRKSFDRCSSICAATKKFITDDARSLLGAAHREVVGRALLSCSLIFGADMIECR